MKKTIRILLLSCLAASLSACVSIRPLQVESNNGPANLVGESTCFNVFVIPLGDCSYETAKKNGNITTVHHTDKHLTDYMIFSKQKTIVYGSK
jgi:TRL (tRNA-associated locus)-like protein